MDDETLQARLHMLEVKVALLEQAQGAENGGVRENNVAFPIPSLASVTPDEVSTEFIPDPAQGAEPDGDEGNLQIKGFKAGSPTDANNTIADYLSGGASLPSGGMQIVCRWTDSNGAHLVYLPIAALNGIADISGLNGLKVVTDVKYNENGDYKIVATRREMQVQNGVISLKQHAAADDQEIATTPHSAEVS